MTPERWGRVEELYHSCLSLPEPARAALLAQACEGDAALRAEVESLLAHAEPQGLAAASLSPPVLAATVFGEPNTLVGRQFGDYRVERWIGSGGMGVVYQAQDVRLQRPVALKLLPPLFASDAGRVKRLGREARILASLNHPNITTVHELAEFGESHAIVMEFVDGETVDALLHGRGAGSGLPLRQSLTIARGVAEALEAAHEKGVVHRDLKPANIKVAGSGLVKVLDFGLARGVADADTIPGSRGSGDTLPGQVVGTPAYMSPEQARGHVVDHHADIWAFGCVLYEMLTGRAVFHGATPADVIAQVLNAPVDLEALPAGTPHALRQLIQRCLEKDTRRRLQHMGDARIEVDDLLADVGSSGSRAPLSMRRSDPRRHLGAGIAAGVAVGVLAAVTAWGAFGVASPQPAPVTHMQLATAPGRPLMPTLYRDLAMAPDGSRFAYRTTAGVVVRSRDGRPDVVVPVEPAAAHFFFSPDGQWLGYSSSGAIRKVPVNGGTPVTVVGTGSATVGTWGDTGVVYTDSEGLHRQAEDGGFEQVPVPGLTDGEQLTFPDVLPGGRAALVTVMATRAFVIPLTGLADSAGGRIEVVDMRSGERKLLLQGGGAARYSPTGHLLYLSAGTLMALPFDLARLEATGEPMRVVTEPGVSDFAVSFDGTLVYVSGDPLTLQNELVWVDRIGGMQPVGAPKGLYVYPELSPDGSRAALVALEPSRGDRDVWLWDFTAQTLDRLVSDETDNPTVAWSLDGQHVAFGRSGSNGAVGTFWRWADGVGEAELLSDSLRVQLPIDFAPDGRLLLSVSGGGNRDIVSLSIDDERQLVPVLHGPGSELSADVSPDGRWLAYDSDETGHFEVYVRPYPDVDAGRWMISTGGGRQPVWAPDGSELFYRDFTGAMMSAAVTTTPSFRVGPRTKLFEGTGLAGAGSGGSSQTYDISPDGRRFLMVRVPGEPALVLTLNWSRSLQPVTTR
ncbi:MAG: serine/threonine-protein kinase [Acidobacteria bacterium]|nr:serine/threonine-protein kinase [Acidobacteriota bacterium]